MDRISTKGQMVDQVDLKGLAHSAFDRSNHNFGTGRLGAIIPMRLDGVYPGDRIKARPEGVVNFEPLAAPLMGTMVMKQESFFVPCHQLWRHAYKFFTGKNGFNDPWPSVSPKHIWDVYCQYIHNEIWSADEHTLNFWNVVNSISNFYEANIIDTQFPYSWSEPLLRDRVISAVEDAKTRLESVYSSRKMLDLVQPLYYIFDNFANSAELIEISNKFYDVANSYTTKEDMRPDFYTLCDMFADLYKRIFDFFHGASSLFDYLGWPCLYDTRLNTLNWDDSFPYNEAEHGNMTIFQYIVRVHVFHHNDYYNKIGDYFSNVSLNFSPFKAYYLIWYWNYRDQLLETNILDPDEDEFLGSEITDNVILYTTLMRQRCWFKDTFTTALTNTGDGNFLVPTGGGETTTYKYYTASGDLVNTTDADQVMRSGATICKVVQGEYEYDVPMNYLSGAIDHNTTRQNLTTFISLDIFDRIKRLRSFVQKRLILGYEVDDVVWSSFLVRMSNVRIHIPELLGQGRDVVEMNTVVNNTSTAEQIAGDKTATAWCHGQSSVINYFAEEWGLFMTFVTIMPIQSYSGGMQRLYLKR